MNKIIFLSDKQSNYRIFLIFIHLWRYCCQVRRQTDWQNDHMEGASVETSSQKRKKKKETRKHMKKITYFQCVILSRVTVPEQRVRRRARQQHVAGLFLSFPSHVPVKNQSYEPVYWPNWSSKQMTYRFPSSGLGWAQVLCVRDIKLFDLRRD